MNQQQAALIVKLVLTDEQSGLMVPDVAPRHYGVVREWGEKGGTIVWGGNSYNSGSTEPHFIGFHDYHIAPRTVTITGPGGTFEIPEPVREPIKHWNQYWVADFGGVETYDWCDCRYDKVFLAQGRIHLTEEAAQAHADALAKLMGVQS